jgi:hypothetical protein
MNSDYRKSLSPDAETLRTLSDVLDIRLGIDMRKAIMAGSEQLSLRTDTPAWSRFATSVSDRLSSMVGEDAMERLLNQAGLFNTSHPQS